MKNEMGLRWLRGVNTPPVRANLTFVAQERGTVDQTLRILADTRVEVAHRQLGTVGVALTAGHAAVVETDLTIITWFELAFFTTFWLYATISVFIADKNISVITNTVALTWKANNPPLIAPPGAKRGRIPTPHYTKSLYAFLPRSFAMPMRLPRLGASTIHTYLPVVAQKSRTIDHALGVLANQTIADSHLGTFRIPHTTSYAAAVVADFTVAAGPATAVLTLVIDTPPPISVTHKNLALTGHVCFTRVTEVRWRWVTPARAQRWSLLTDVQTVAVYTTFKVGTLGT